MLVSVVIPTWNTPRRSLERSIKSVLDQTHWNLECRVVDDGSDVPFQRLNSVFKDQRLRFVSLTSNYGVSHARNVGIDLSSGKYIAFLDAGDIWYPKKLEAQVALVETKSNIGLVYTGARFTAPGYGEFILLPEKPQSWYRTLLIRNCIVGSASTALVPRSVIDKVGGFFEEYDIPEDRDLWLRISKEYEITFDDNIMANIVLEPDSRSSNPLVNARIYRKFVERWKSEMKDEKVYYRALANYHSVIAHKHFLSGMTSQGVKHSFMALLCYPRKRRTIARLYTYIKSQIKGEDYLKNMLA